MKYPFKIQEAKKCMQEHKSIINEAVPYIASVQQYNSNIINIVNNIADEEIDKKLMLIPIEELYKEKKGYKVKVLKDLGLNTFLDISNISITSLIDMKGVGDSSAYALKEYIEELRKDIKKDVKIKLSADNNTTLNYALINDLAKNIELNNINNFNLDDYKRDLNEIRHNISILEKGLGLFNRFFGSNKIKKDATDAFYYLYSLLNNEYKQQSKSIINTLKHIDNIDTHSSLNMFINDPISFINMLEKIIPGITEHDQSDYGLPKDLAEAIMAECIYPDGLLCSLRRYQEWGVKYILHQENVLLGDEMGLGKTIQAIAAMVSLRNTGATHFIVVCPASVLSNWCREVKKFSTLIPTKIHGKDRIKAFESWKINGGVAVTTYETTGYLKLNDFKYNMLVVDEAHYIKNPSANRTQNVVNLSKHAERKLFMTGTALENRVEEMISLISYLNPSISKKIEDMTNVYSSSDFRKTISNVYFRRRRDDVLNELPDLIENEIWCSLNDVEEDIYVRSVLDRKYAECRKLSWNVPDLKDSSKADSLLDIVEDAKNEDRKIIVFSFFLDTISKIAELLGENATQPITGSIPPEKRQMIIDDFNKAPAGKVLLAQIVAGGTGLSIQSASVVVLCEPQFKPSIENQAISRAYRMGQARNVLVYRLLCEDTIEEKIMDILKEKQMIFNEYADKSEAALETLSIDEKTMGNIIQEEIDRINAKQ